VGRWDRDRELVGDRMGKSKEFGGKENGMAFREVLGIT
jgi:hypothetical protein